MALDKTTLTKSLKETFTNAKTQQWTSDQVAEALANAFDAYVRNADVVSVQVQVKNLTDTVIGTGTQNNKGKLE